MLHEITSKNQTRPQTDVARLSGSPSQHHTITFQSLFHSSPQIQCRGPRQTAHWYMHWIIHIKDHYNYSPLIRVVSSPLLYFLLLGVVFFQIVLQLLWVAELRCLDPTCFFDWITLPQNQIFFYNLFVPFILRQRRIFSIS